MIFENYFLSSMFNQNINQLILLLLYIKKNSKLSFGFKISPILGAKCNPKLMMSDLSSNFSLVYRIKLFRVIEREIGL